MKNAEIVKARLHALIDKANNTTGESDTTLIGAVNRLVDNYGNQGYEEGYAQGKSDGVSEGYADGKADGASEGIEQGKQAEYDAFWDGFQDNGNRDSYGYAFRFWKHTEIKPKYPIVSSEAIAMFTTDSNLISPPQVIAKDGYFPSIYTMFTNCNAMTSIDWDIPVSGTASSVLGNVFLNCYSLVTIKKLIVDCPTTVPFNNMTFGYCYALENIEFGGVIRNNGLNLQWSKKLSRASIESIINTLSTDTTGLTVTISLDAVKKAFETSEGANDGNTATEWTTLTATKPNWTISLA